MQNWSRCIRQCLVMKAGTTPDISRREGFNAYATFGRAKGAKPRGGKYWRSNREKECYLEIRNFFLSLVWTLERALQMMQKHRCNGCFDWCWAKIQEHGFHWFLLQLPLIHLWPFHLKLLLEPTVTSSCCQCCHQGHQRRRKFKKRKKNASFFLPLQSLASASNWSNHTGNPLAREHGKITLHTFIFHTKENKEKLEWSWKTVHKYMGHEIMYLFVNKVFKDVTEMCYKIKTTHY